MKKMLFVILGLLAAVSTVAQTYPNYKNYSEYRALQETAKNKPTSFGAYVLYGEAFDGLDTPAQAEQMRQRVQNIMISKLDAAAAFSHEPDTLGYYHADKILEKIAAELLYQRAAAQSVNEENASSELSYYEQYVLNRVAKETYLLDLTDGDLTASMQVAKVMRGVRKKDKHFVFAEQVSIEQVNQKPVILQNVFVSTSKYSEYNWEVYNMQGNKVHFFASQDYHFRDINGLKKLVILKKHIRTVLTKEGNKALRGRQTYF